MSVMIINKSSLELLGKFLTISISEEKALEKVKSLHDLNTKNYAIRYQGDITPCIDSFEIYNQPLISPEQAVKTLESLYYNCVDYGKDINLNLLNEIEKMVDDLKNHYTLNEDLLEMAIWG
jgi:hypothetical protein